MKAWSKPSRKEKLAQQPPTHFTRDLARHRRVMVEASLGKQIDDAAAGSRLRIAGAEHEPPDACMQNRSRTHRARLERDIQVAVRPGVIVERSRRLAQRGDLGVRSRIVGGDRRVARAPDY